MKNVNSVTIQNTALNNSQVIKKVDLAFVPWEDNSMYNAFSNCQNLIEVTNINNDVVNMYNTFNNCANLVSVPNIPSSVTNMRETFYYCNKLTGTINIYSENVSTARDCFDRTNKTKLVLIPFKYANNVNTMTYNAFIDEGYSTTSKVNGVVLRDMYGDPTFREWLYYNNTTNNSYGLTEYIGSSKTVVVPNENTYFNIGWMGRQENYFRNNPTIEEIDLNFVPCQDNRAWLLCSNCPNLTTVSNFNNNITSFESVFYNCSNLVNVPTIPDGAIYLVGIFSQCTNLVNVPTIPNSVLSLGSAFSGCHSLVNAPVIPNSVTNMYGTFISCSNLVNAPIIPNSVTNMAYTFQGCLNLVNVPEIPNSVTNMVVAFSGCYNLVSAPNIPSSVTNLASTFYSCFNLTGNIRIYAREVTDVSMFASGNKNKDVYVYSGSNTYKTFTSAGYSTSSRNTYDGILLKYL